MCECSPTLAEMIDAIGAEWERRRALAEWHSKFIVAGRVVETVYYEPPVSALDVEDVRQ